MKKIKLLNIIYFTLVTVLLSVALFTGCGGENDDGGTSNEIGAQSSFYDDVGNTVSATARQVVEANGKKLIIWVADNQWNPSGEGLGTGKINQALANEMADAFLKPGNNNDLYEWITGIFGAEWGAHPYGELIGTTNEIHILLYDIDNDASTTGGVLGFFYSRDTFKKSFISKSNEKNMFYIDSVLYATSAYWKSELISTLAHEFQHMIHWYQKGVLANKSSDTWLDEMCALTAEDFVADKLQVNGPRGVLYSDYTSGSTDNTEGRLPLYNYFNEAPLTTWLSGNDVYKSYSIAYAFGAYLARNHGGPGLFRSIVQDSAGDHNAVSNSVLGYTFEELLREWGVSVVLSDKTVALPPITSNSTATVDGVYFSTPSSGTVSYTLDSGTQKNVYFIITNANTDSEKTKPGITVSNLYDPNFKLNKSMVQPVKSSASIIDSEVIINQRGKPEITAFNSTAFALIDRTGVTEEEIKKFQTPVPLYNGTGIKYGYNKGDKFSWTLDNIEYNLGSIDLYNYKYNTQSVTHSGPWFYNTENVPAQLKRGSNTYVDAGSVSSGTWTFNFLPENVTVTMVVRD